MSLESYKVDIDSTSNDNSEESGFDGSGNILDVTDFIIEEDIASRINSMDSGEDEVSDIVFHILNTVFPQSNIRKGEISVTDRDWKEIGSWKADIVIEDKNIAIECKGRKSHRQGLGQALTYAENGYDSILACHNMVEDVKSAIMKTHVSGINILDDGSIEFIGDDVIDAELPDLDIEELKHMKRYIRALKSHIEELRCRKTNIKERICEMEQHKNGLKKDIERNQMELDNLKDEKSHIEDVIDGHSEALFTKLDDRYGVLQKAAKFDIISDKMDSGEIDSLVCDEVLDPMWVLEKS